MPRRARRTMDSQFLHIIVQGINREFIFNNQENIKKYYELMLNKRKEYDVNILAYCIMNNHAHILIHSNKIDNISKYMKSLNTAYAQYYNKTKNRVGYVFRDRFKSQEITNEWYLYNCISYIHYNPVKAGIVNKPSEYKYSSYNDFINKTGIVSDKTIKLIFGGTKGYIDIFQFIHYSEGEAMEAEETENKIEYKCKIDITNKAALQEECKKLKSYKISNRRIAEMLGVNRNKVDRLLK